MRPGEVRCIADMHPDKADRQSRWHRSSLIQVLKRRVNEIRIVADNWFVIHACRKAPGRTGHDHGIRT
jgi:hypothetical protein